MLHQKKISVIMKIYLFKVKSVATDQNNDKKLHLYFMILDHLRLTLILLFLQNKPHLYCLPSILLLRICKYFQ